MTDDVVNGRLVLLVMPSRYSMKGRKLLFVLVTMLVPVTLWPIVPLNFSRRLY